MAKDKKGFVLYADMKGTFDKLPNEKAGELIKHIFSYVNDENPEPKDLIIEIAFEPIKNQLKRDLKKYEKTCNKNRENAFKRWNKEDTTASERMRTDTKNADKDNDTDKEIDNDKEIILNESAEKTIDFICKKFGVTEMKHFLNYRLIYNCVVCQFGLGDELFKHFKDQCWNYFIYKDLAKEKLHSIKTFIGNPEEKYIDGGWNADNWIKKHTDMKAKEAGIESTVYKKDEEKGKVYYSGKRNSNETDLTKIGDFRK